MPSSATITAFYNFAAGTKARASHVNSNFDAVRGHYIPIDPNTLTAGITNTWDLGSSEHRWRTGYFASGIILSPTTTVSAAISGNTSGSVSILAEGGTRAVFALAGTQLDTGNTSTAGHTFRINGAAKAGVDTNGWTGNNGNTSKPNTTSAGLFQVAIGTSISATYTYGAATGTGTDVAGSGISIQTLGRPVLIGFQGSLRWNGNPTSSSSFVSSYPKIEIVRETTTTEVITVGAEWIIAMTTTAFNTSTSGYLQVRGFLNTILPDLPAGTHNFFMRSPFTGNLGSLLVQGKLIAWEIT